MKVFTVLTFLCCSLIVVAIRDCERGIVNDYCIDPNLVWTENIDGKCYKGHCGNKMEYCKQVECEGLVSRSFDDTEDVYDATTPNESSNKKDEF